MSLSEVRAEEAGLSDCLRSDSVVQKVIAVSVRAAGPLRSMEEVMSSMLVAIEV